MADQNVRGRFVWHELATPDQPGALAFYTRVLGWKKVPWEQDPQYSMFAAERGPLGGAGASPGSAAHWTPFISTADIDATVGQAQSLGATVKTPVTQIPQAGKYAVLADPQGAAFGVHWSATAPGADTAPGVGEFSWHELAALDYGAAFEFYNGLFGWDKLAEHDMGPMGIYLIFGRNGSQLGGMFNKGNAGLPGGANWLAYVRVRDVHATVERIKAAGGRLASGPMEVPGGDWIAQCLDPAGALFAVHTLAADLKAARPAPPARERAAGKPAAEQTAGATKGSRKKAVEKKKSTKKAAAKTKPAKKKATKKKPAKKKASKKKAAKKKAGKRVVKKAGKRKVSKAKSAKKKGAKAAKKKAAKKKSAKKAAKKSARKKATARKGTKAAKRKTSKKTGKKANRKGKQAKRKRTAAKKKR